MPSGWSKHLRPDGMSIFGQPEERGLYDGRTEKHVWLSEKEFRMWARLYSIPPCSSRLQAETEPTHFGTGVCSTKVESLGPLAR